MNEKSASASEIVSGAMQDHDRATIMGEPSFGKGLVQSVFPLGEGNGLALTTALYYTPSGRSIQKPLSTRFDLSATTAHPNKETEFHTDKGRVVTGGGGIQPDIVVYPPPMNRLRAVLDASASFTNFATEYLRTHKIDADFEVTPQLLDEFRAFLSERQIRPGFRNGWRSGNSSPTGSRPSSSTSRSAWKRATRWRRSATPWFRRPSSYWDRSGTYEWPGGVSYCISACPIALRVVEVTARAYRRDSEFRHPDFPAVLFNRADGVIDVIHRMVIRSRSCLSPSPVRGALCIAPGSRIPLVTGVNQVESRRSPRLEPRAENLLVEARAARSHPRESQRS